MSLVVLAMSGGVDSSVAASLLLEQGHEVVGVFMRHAVRSSEACEVDSTTVSEQGLSQQSSALENPLQILSHKQGCCTASDAQDARRVADRLGIPFYALDLSDDFERIVDYFVEEYTRGRTPNPCVMCNHWIKFGKLFDYADSLGADFVATGHYARRGLRSDGPALLRGIDRHKDQAYVLFGIRREQLQRVLLPVGEYRKSEIRARARALGLRVAEKKDSQEICFVPSGKHGPFVAHRTRRHTAGEIVTTEGRVVGSHPGIENFTIGQRKGLGVALGQPYFVTEIDPDTNRVILGRHEELARYALTATGANWLTELPEGEMRCVAQIRYNSPAQPATLRRVSEDRFTLRFDRPCFGIAPGQAAVCFDEDRLLGGGWIDAATE